MAEWINVKDKLPNEGEEVLFWLAVKKKPFIGWLKEVGRNGGAYFITRSNRQKVAYNASFWMPLPKDPEKGSRMTNGDVVRNMTDEELIEFAEICPYPKNCPKIDCAECALNWLKQPSKEV